MKSLLFPLFKSVVENQPANLINLAACINLVKKHSKGFHVAVVFDRSSKLEAVSKAVMNFVISFINFHHQKLCNKIVFNIVKHNYNSHSSLTEEQY